MKYATPLVLVALMFASSVRAADPDKTAPAGQAEFAVGEMRVQEMPATNYVYGSAETTFKTIMEPIGKYMTMLSKALDEGRFRPDGPAMFVYRGVGEDMSKPFTLEVGWCVSERTREVEGLKVRKAEAFKCATVLYTGPLSKIMEAYKKLMPAVLAAGLTPTGAVREMYLFFERTESANNVVQVEVGVK